MTSTTNPSTDLQSIRGRGDAALTAALLTLPGSPDDLSAALLKMSKSADGPSWSWTEPTKDKDAAAGRMLLKVNYAWDSWAYHALIRAGLIVDYRNSTLLVEDGLNADGSPWYPKTRRQSGDPELAAGADSRLTLAWALKSWGHGDADSLWFNAWRHVLECDTVAGDVEFGTASSGACSTCAHTYPAVLFWIRCGCGLLNVGTSRSPIDISTDGGMQLQRVLSELDGLVEEYLAEDATHACWLGWSKRRR